MAMLPIRIYPDPILRQVCRPVKRFDTELAQLAADMIETMHAAPGVGLAAPQVGLERRLAVVDASVGENAESLLVMVNPEILEESGSETDSEGCLSIPEVTDKVTRPTRIRIRAQRLDGSVFELIAEGFEARVICHEVDHLNGVLFTDRLRGLRRERAKRQLRRLAEEQEAIA